MKFAVKVGAALSLCTLIFPGAAYAAECDSNFTSSGNFLSSQTFKTSFEVPNVQPDSVFLVMHRKLAQDGMTIKHADQRAGVLTAWHVGSRPDRPHALNLTVEPTQRGATLSLSVSLPSGVFASASGFQQEFCKLAAVVEATASAPDKSQPVSLAVSTAVEAGTRPNTQSGDGGRLCLGKACLGMTLQQAAELPLEDQRSAFKIEKEYGDSRGLDSKNNRLKFNTNWVDQKWIRQYSEAVKVACVLDNAMASLKASDGEDIHLDFSAAFVNGKGVLQLTRISRSIPKNLSVSQWQAFEEQARTRYGAAYGAVSYSHVRPSVHISRTIAHRSLVIAMPQETNANAKMMEQPGCSDRASLE